MQTLNFLKKRYATKVFDPQKKISSTTLDLLKKAIQLTPSSFGLQPYKVISVKDSNIKAQLKKAALNQAQVTDASDLFIFAAFDKIDPLYITNHIKLMSETRNQSYQSLNSYKEMITTTLTSMSSSEMKNWANNQSYIALGQLLSACAQLEIDACPMEGFNKEEVNNILHLTEKNLHSTFMVAIGYRSEKDNYQHLKKVRKPMDQLFIDC